MKLIKTTKLGLMKFDNLDAVAGNTLAEMLGTRHADLIRVIKKAMKYEKSHRASLRSENHTFDAVFKKWKYQNVRGRTYDTYIMNEDALYLVISYLEYSPKAHEAKVWFKSEFNKMKLERYHRADAKVLSKPVTDQLQQLYESLHDEGSSQKEEFLYTNFHKKSYKAITGQKFEKDKLDQLSYEQACNLAELRDNAARQVELMLVEGKYSAKEIRNRLWKFLDGFLRGQLS